MFSSNNSQVGATGPGVFIEDVFSTYLYTGNGSSQTIQNGINLGSANSGGSGYFDGSGDYLQVASNAAFGFGTGDFTVEAWVYPNISGTMVVADVTLNIATFYVQSNTLKFYAGGGAYDSGLAVTATAWNHVAWVRSSGSIKMYVNGVGSSSVSVTTNLGSSEQMRIGVENNSYWNGYISNLRVVKGTAVYTGNFTPSTTPLTAISGTSLLTCQGELPFVDNSANAFSLTVNGNTTATVFGPFTSATAAKGGLVWIKSRDGVGYPSLYDSVRGVKKRLTSNTTGAEYIYASTGVTGFSANGFSVSDDGSGGDNVNGSPGGAYSGNGKYVSWAFRNQPKFFDVQTATKAGGIVTFNHNLGAAPGMVLVKCLNTAESWHVYHRSLGVSQYLFLNSTQAVGSYGNLYTSSSTQFLQNSADGTNYVAYLFAHNAGGFGPTGTDNVISCGSYTGNGSAAGPTVTLGWEPQWILIKNITSVIGWYIVDNMRGFPKGVSIFPNDYIAESAALANSIQINSTGFTLTQTYAAINASGSEYIYMAIRRGPMAVPTVGTSVYENTAYTGNATAQRKIGSSVLLDLLLLTDRSATSINWESYAQLFYDRLRGTVPSLSTSNLNAEVEDWSSYVDLDMNTGWDTGSTASQGYLNNTSATYVSHAFKRAPGFFDIVTYKGTGVARTITHNLTVVPQMMIVKRRSGSADWTIYHVAMGATKYTLFDGSTELTGTRWNNTTPTSSVFSVDSSYYVNDASSTYVAYLFATCAGVSKVGSYTGTAALQTINCGFTGGGARFVLIHRIDSGSNNWWLYNSAAGISSGNDPYLFLNSTAAEVANTNYVDAHSTGFQITADAPAQLNANGGTYIFLAIA